MKATNEQRLRDDLDAARRLSSAMSEVLNDSIDPSIIMTALEMLFVTTVVIAGWELDQALAEFGRRVTQTSDALWKKHGESRH